MLFIASGAFSLAKPSDLIPELQGRLPIRVELSALSVEDFKRILSEPHNALTKQYAALLGTEGVELVFEDSGIDRLAEVAFQVNARTENIGARRLHTVHGAPAGDDLLRSHGQKRRKIRDRRRICRQHAGNLVEDQDLSRYIL